MKAEVSITGDSIYVNTKAWREKPSVRRQVYRILEQRVADRMPRLVAERLRKTVLWPGDDLKVEYTLKVRYDGS